MVEQASDPDGAARRHGLAPEQFQDLIARGCAKVNISTALKIAFVDSFREYLEANPTKHDPPVPAEARGRRGQGDGHRAHADLRLGGQGAHSRNRLMPALFFDCDGVLADTERFGHLPAFNETFEQEGLPVRWSDSEYAEKLLIGGGKERMASLLTDEFVREQRTAGRSRGPARAARPLAHARRPRPTRPAWRRARCPARPGVARIVDEALAAGWTLAVASTSAEESVRATLEHAVGDEKAAHFSVLAGDVGAGQEARPGDLPAGAGAHRRRPARDDRHRGLAQRSPRGGGRGPALRGHRQQLHGRRGLLGGRARGLEPRRPGRAGSGPRQSQPGRARAVHHTGRPSGVPGGPCPQEVT